MHLHNLNLKSEFTSWMIMDGGHGPRKYQPSGIIHGHLILVRYKQAQICLQSGPKPYEQISMKF